jgi:beta-mannosidase
MKTIESFTLPEDRASIFTPVMKAHQKNGDGNRLIQEYMKRYFGEPKDFASFLYASQVLQAEGIKVGAESFRRKMPETMGSLFWQLNDCWPVASWASIDYYGRWKALQYYARRFYAPVLVSPHVDGGTLSIFIVSDKTASIDGTLRLRIMDFSGKIIKETSQAVKIDPLASRVYQQIPLVELSGANAPDWSGLVGVADVTVGGQKVSTNLVYFVPSKQIQLPHASVSAEISQARDGYDVALTSAGLARSVYVSFGELDAQFSDNYFDLLPGEKQTIHVTSKATLADLKSQMKVMSLVDAFSSPAMEK